ncbi:MAG: phage terminase small subunit P27 family [Actinoplanes sp.]
MRALKIHIRFSAIIAGMGKRGPVPIPPGLKILAGRSPGRDSGGRPIPKVPAFERCAPEPPDWLDLEALAEWERIVPALDAVGSIKPEDRGIITARCVAWSRAVHAEAIIAAEGQTVVNPQSGRLATHPAVYIAAAAWRDVVKFGAPLGLDPSSEVNLATTATDDDDENDPFGAYGDPS